MKRVLLIILFSLAYILNVFSQGFQRSLPSYVKLASEVSIEGNYFIKVLETEDEIYSVSISDENENMEMFTIKPLSYSLFESKLISTYIALVNKSESIIIDKSFSNELIKELKVSMLFNQIVSYINSTESREEVAIISLRDFNKVSVYQNENCDKKKKPIKIVDLKLENPQLELAFNEGFIEKVEVVGAYGSEKIRFTNRYSIGISSRSNIEELNNIVLSSFRNYGINRIDSIKEISLLSFNSRDSNKVCECKLKLYLGDIIDYDRIIDVNANDISPKPQRIILDRNQTSAKLYREESTKILEAIVYSDFIGVFNEEEPNGIIQVEVLKRFNLNTKKHDVFNTGLSKLLLLPSTANGLGLFQYVDLSFNLSKIEENNRFFMGHNFEFIDLQGQTTNKTYFSPLGLYQYQNYSFGLDFNLMNLENQDLKTDVDINFGFKYGRSGVKFELNKEGDYVNTFEIPISIKFNVVPEKRYGLNWTNELIYYKILSEKNRLLSSLEKNKLVNHRNFLFSSELMSYLNISSKGKLFFRYKILFDPKFVNENFSQFQFGYSFYLLKKNGVR